MQTKQVTVIYENGVFKPLEEVDVKEHEKLIVTLYSDAQWQKEVNALFKKIHKRTKNFSTKEIETDISEAKGSRITTTGTAHSS